MTRDYEITFEMLIQEPFINQSFMRYSSSFLCATHIGVMVE